MAVFTEAFEEALTELVDEFAADIRREVEAQVRSKLLSHGPFFEQLCGERLRQQTLGYTDEHDSFHTRSDWGRILRAELEEFGAATTLEAARTEAVHVAAVAMAAWEALTAHIERQDKDMLL